ncbi:hypothetical protein CYMTET_22789 [Cymbomonas tetramitiformis]|uniref:SET domain-containing protein n=1 Tax=Cymbomonas tetramitiformis TaxID=36881 RepID=A0AAE0FZK6_9CHLO|nr:hypothetical protein CYMTET_22789 [Cymbomonas tetramitiformis]|eukprot:gene20954-25144_t
MSEEMPGGKRKRRPDSSDLPPAMSEMIFWLEENEVDLSNLSIRTSKECGGIGVFTKSTASVDAMVVRIPQRLVLSIEKVRTSLVGQAVLKTAARLGVQVSGEVLLKLFMIVGRSSSENFWNRYLTSIPPVFSSPLHWPEEVVERELGGTNLKGEVDVKRRDLREKYDALAPHLLQEFPELFEDVLSFDSFMWAHSAYSSRSFPPQLVEGRDNEAKDGGDTIGCMLPLLDILNHKYKTPITWVADRESVGMRVGAEVDAGCEIFNNYGPKGNEELLYSYGFCLVDNPADIVAVRYACVEQDVETANSKLELLQSQDVPVDIMSDNPCGLHCGPFLLTRDALPGLLLLTFRICLCGHLDPTFENTRAALRQLRSLLKDKLRAMGEAKKLRDLLPPGQKTAIERDSANYRKGQKRVLEASVQFVKDGLERLEVQHKEDLLKAKSLAH